MDHLGYVLHDILFKENNQSIIISKETSILSEILNIPVGGKFSGKLHVP